MTNSNPSYSVGADQAKEQRLDRLQTFHNYLRYERNLSQRTLDSYRDDLEDFEAMLEQEAPDVTWDTLDADLIRQWVMVMMDRGNKATSVNRRLSALRTFFKFLLRRGYVTVDPAHTIVGPKKEKVLPSYVRDSEMDRLLDGDLFPEGYTGVRDRTILLTLYSAGLRASELTGLRVKDVEMESMQLRVTGKRNKQRILPFGEEMHAQLEQYLQAREQLLKQQGGESEALFLNERTQSPLDYKRLRVMVKKYLTLATTAKKKSPHTLRHTFATSMLNHHADLRSVKELLGHESLATTEIYTHTSFADLQNAYQMAHPRAVRNDEEEGK